jgi:hypothetical protein
MARDPNNIPTVLYIGGRYVYSCILFYCPRALYMYYCNSLTISGEMDHLVGFPCHVHHRSTHMPGRQSIPTCMARPVTYLRWYSMDWTCVMSIIPQYKCPGGNGKSRQRGT